MKKFNYIFMLGLLLAAVSMNSCKNEVDDIFDRSAAERLNESVTYFEDALLDKGGKWQMEYFSNAGEQGYVYIMTFNKNGSVQMSGNNKFINYLYTGSTASAMFASQTSAWEIITDDGPVLSFNTYNPIFHLFATPEDIPSTESINELGYGHEGDYEFNLMRYTGDSLIMKGKKWGLEIVMTRLDPGTNDEVYLNHVVALADSFFTAKVPLTFLTLPDGQRYKIRNAAKLLPELCPEYVYEEVNPETHERKWMEGDWISYKEEYNAIITPAGFSFMNPITLGDSLQHSTRFTVQHFMLQPDGSLLCRDDGVSTIKADTLSKVFFDASIKWGSQINLSAGALAEAYKAADQEMRTVFAATKRSIDCVEIYKTNSSAALPNTYVINFRVKSGNSPSDAFVEFIPVRVAEDQIRFQLTGVMNNNANTFTSRVPLLKTFMELLGSTTFKLEPTSMLAPTTMKLIDVNDPSSYLTFIIK